MLLPLPRRLLGCCLVCCLACLPGLMGEFGSSSVGGPGASDPPAYRELPQGAPMKGEYPLLRPPSPPVGADVDSEPELPSELIDRPSCAVSKGSGRRGGGLHARSGCAWGALTMTNRDLAGVMPPLLHGYWPRNCCTHSSTASSSDHSRCLAPLGLPRPCPARPTGRVGCCTVLDRCRRQPGAPGKQRTTHLFHASLEAGEGAEHRLTHGTSTGSAYSLAWGERNCSTYKSREGERPSGGEGLASAALAARIRARPGVIKAGYSIDPARSPKEASPQSNSEERAPPCSSGPAASCASIRRKPSG